MNTSNGRLSFDNLDSSNAWNSRVAILSSTSSNIMGVGTLTPSAALHVVGNILASGEISAFSDARLKTDIEPIDGACSKLLAIRGYTYRMRSDLDGAPHGVDVRTHMGVLAHEVESVAPQLVHTASDGMKSVAYGNMTALLIEGLREIHAMLELVGARVSRIEARL
jgi:hypothetical protein